jgi:hypothetical protein
MLAPIVLFVYNRPWHTGQTLNALSNNILANESILYIFADGVKETATEADKNNIAEVRRVIRRKQWCKEVYIIESENNKGLADSIINGITEIVNQYGKIIVLEDDIVTSKSFLKYMNDALYLYKDNDKVMHISGFVPRNKGLNFLPETYFLKYMSCWGWATWQRAWNNICLDTNYLYQEITKDATILNDYNLDGVIRYEGQLEANLSGLIYTWAIKWFTTIYLKGGLCLYPKRSLVQNIGFDGSGVHCGNQSDFNVKLFDKILVKPRQVKESKRARKHLKNFFNSLNPSISFSQKVKRKLKKVFKKSIIKLE